MKDIGYATGRRYLENYTALYTGGESASKLTNWISSGRIRYAIFTQGHGQDQLAINPTLLNWVTANCKLVRAFGDYRIYQYVGDGTRDPTKP